jgi:hypothetical protein
VAVAAPDKWNWLNQAVNEVATVLRADTAFMASTALAGGVGVVTQVVEHDIEQAVMARHGVVVCAVRYGGHARADDDDAAGQTDYLVRVDIRLMGRLPLEHRPADRVGLLTSLQRAASCVETIMSREINPNGGRFGGFSELAFADGASPDEQVNEDGYFAGITSGIRLQVTLVDA